MAKPQLNIVVQPLDGSAIGDLPLAAAASDESAFVKLVVRLDITNAESKPVTITDIKFSFPGSNVNAITMKGTDIYYSNSLNNIAAGATVTWSNGKVDLDTAAGDDHVNMISNIVFLPSPPPAKVTISLTCKTFSDPFTVTMNLTPHKSTTASGSYLLPFSAGDLQDGEYVVTSADHWANGGAQGPQIYAHDIGIEGIDPNTKKLNALFPNTDGKKNSHYRIWGKPVRAMADGVIEDFSDGLNDNTVLGEFPDPTPDPGEGNHVWIRHGSELTVYCHFQHGSMVPEVKHKGAKVKAGQMLGRAGNTGNTTNPHTHIHCLADSTSGPLRPLPFHNAWVLDHARFNPPKADDLWVPMSGKGISKDLVSIWPESTWPTYRIPAAGISRAGDWANSFFIEPDLESFQKTAQDLFDKKGRRLIWVSSYVEHGHRRWAGISRAGDWANSFWISPDRAAFEKEAQDLFDNKKQRLVYVTTYPEGGHTRWIGISRSGDWANSFWISADRAAFEKEAQDLFDKKGRRLIHVTTYLENGHRRWVGISRSGDWANSFWISADRAAFEKEAQDLFDQKGRRLVCLHTYVEDGHRRWVGISRSGDWANSFFISSDLDSFSREAQNLFDDKGRRLIAVEFLAS